MATKIQIWNMALGFIGTRTVASETERTPEAIQCSLFWDCARREALRVYPWNFAQVREWLAQKNIPEVYAGQWRYAYAFPELCLRLHCVRHATDQERAFQVVRDNDGTALILTDIPRAMGDYTRDIKDVSVWDDAFIQVMARRLACLIAIPLLKNNTGKIQELEQLYRAAMPLAQEANASEQHEKPEIDAWLTARWGMCHDS